MSSSDQQASFIAKYDLKKRLGKGAFSVVHLCVHKEDGEERAVKIFNASSMSKRDRDKIQKEVNINNMLHHVNITKFHEIFREEKHYFMVFELISGGELFDQIVERSHYSEKDASKLINQVAGALKYMHSLEIIHRDLKPENLLLSDKSLDAVVKLADFGLSLEVDAAKPTFHGLAGSPGYIAPEIAQRRAYGKPSDVFSLGVIFYILICGYQPFHHPNNTILIEMSKNPPCDFHSPEWDTVSDEVKQLIRGMMEVDQSKRLNLGDLLKSSWILDLNKTPSTLHKASTLVKMKEFNTQRKFRNALCSLISTQNFAEGIKLSQSQHKSISQDESHKDPKPAADKAISQAELSAISTRIIDNSRNIETRIISQGENVHEISKFYHNNAKIVSQTDLKHVLNHISDEKQLIQKHMVCAEKNYSKRARMKSIVVEEVRGAIIVIYQRHVILKDENSDEEKIVDQCTVTRVWSNGRMEDTNGGDAAENLDAWLIISEHMSRKL